MLLKRRYFMGKVQETNNIDNDNENPERIYNDNDIVKEVE